MSVEVNGQIEVVKPEDIKTGRALQYWMRNQNIKSLYEQGLSISFLAEQFNMKPREIRGAIGRKNIVR